MGSFACHGQTTQTWAITRFSFAWWKRTGNARRYYSPHLATGGTTDCIGSSIAYSESLANSSFRRSQSWNGSDRRNICIGRSGRYRRRLRLWANQRWRRRRHAGASGASGREIWTRECRVSCPAAAAAARVRRHAGSLPPLRLLRLTALPVQALGRARPSFRQSRRAVQGPRPGPGSPRGTACGGARSPAWGGRTPYAVRARARCPAAGPGLSWSAWGLPLSTRAERTGPGGPDSGL